LVHVYTFFKVNNYVDSFPGLSFPDLMQRYKNIHNKQQKKSYFFIMFTNIRDFFAEIQKTTTFESCISLKLSHFFRFFSIINQ